MTITAAQIRAARALLGWTQTDLGSHIGMTQIALSNIEKGSSTPRPSNLQAIQNALEQAGVEFLHADGSDNQSGIGVRLK